MSVYKGIPYEGEYNGEVKCVVMVMGEYEVHYFRVNEDFEYYTGWHDLIDSMLEDYEHNIHEDLVSVKTAEEGRVESCEVTKSLGW